MEWQVAEVAETESTNADLLAAARDGAVEGTVHLTWNQTAGRGRLDRTWEIPPGTGLALSALVRPKRPLGDWSWLPLLAGIATVGAVREATGVSAELKWPNDVLVDGRKLAGVLVESAGNAAIVGIGLNVSMSEEQLPVPGAISLSLAGAAQIDQPSLVDAVLAHLARWYRRWEAGADLVRPYTEDCATISQRVRVTTPAGDIEGVAERIDASGRLVVSGQPINAGDVTHLRPAGGRP